MADHYTSVHDAMLMWAQAGLLAVVMIGVVWGLGWLVRNLFGQKPPEDHNDR